MPANQNATIYQQSTNNNAMARETVAVHHQIGAKRHGLAQIGRYKGCIHHERHAGSMGDLGNHGDLIFHAWITHPRQTRVSSKDECSLKALESRGSTNVV